MGAKPKAAKTSGPQPTEQEEVGLWVDSALIAKLHRQPSTSMFQPASPTGASHLLHFADLALGVVKADKFRSKRVSKTRDRE